MTEGGTELERFEMISLNRSIGEGKLVRSLEIETTVGGGFEMLDTRVTYFDKPNFGRQISLSNAYLMQTGEPVELMEASSEDGDSISIRLNAIIQSVYDMEEGTW